MRVRSFHFQKIDPHTHFISIITKYSKYNFVILTRLAASIQLYKPPGARRSLSLVEDSSPRQQRLHHQHRSTEHDATEAALTAAGSPHSIDTPNLSTDQSTLSNANPELSVTDNCNVPESGHISHENEQCLVHNGDTNNSSFNNNNSR